MSQSVVETNRPRSVTMDMADRFGMEAAAFEQTMRATVVPANCTKEEFAAFLLVARDYGLNPILKEIFAFPKKGGGIQPIVSVDGWLNIINRQPNMDGMVFHDTLSASGELVSITCKIYRKDRAHPIEVTEYMSECKRDTDTWKKWPARMLRHKAAIQCGRYAFGISGLQEPDEYERSEHAVNLNPPPRPTRAQFVEAEVIPPKLDKPMFTVVDSEGVIFEGDASDSAIRLATFLGEAGRMNGLAGLEGVWESNANLLGQLRDAGHAALADELHDYFTKRSAELAPKTEAVKEVKEEAKEEAKPKEEKKPTAKAWAIWGGKAVIAIANADSLEVLDATVSRIAPKMDGYKEWNSEKAGQLAALIEEKRGILAGAQEA